jgi:anti-sigma factor RsiW
MPVLREHAGVVVCTEAMSNVTSPLSEQDMAELSALADGTLPAERRAPVEARVAASPELQELLERQLRALVATRSLTAEPVPASLAPAVQAGRRVRGAGLRRRLAAGLAVAGALAAVVVTAVILSVSGGHGATVADAAQLAVLTPSGPPPSAAGGARLAVSVQGVSFPDLEASYGWRALGVRQGRVDGRDATAVYYGKGTRRLGYVIVAGSALPRPPNAQDTTQSGVLYQALKLNGQPAVTWRRGGHTCILIGAAPAAELLTLASWQAGTLG